VASYNGTVIDEGDVAELQGVNMLPVYQLSARTGSAMYMAPEVYKGELLLLELGQGLQLTSSANCTAMPAVG
jgi:hypothetical protein